jgi:pimeloyl-ACP methyl ester carboxylesterase
MATFGLVHGGSHGAWCWTPLIPELERRGHRAVAMDLPIDLEDSGPERCAAVVADALAGVDAPVLVGHSLAGVFLPLAAARTDASLMVFLCAMVPIEGRSLADQQAEDPDMVRYPYRSVTDELGRTLATRDVAQAMYYSDCTDAQIDWAMPLLRPQAPTLRLTPFPAGGWPDTPAAYVLCTEDPVVSPDWSRRVARERLGVESIELPGGHSPGLSRPADLADVLANIAP